MHPARRTPRNWRGPRGRGGGARRGIFDDDLVSELRDAIAAAARAAREGVRDVADCVDRSLLVGLDAIDAPLPREALSRMWTGTTTRERSHFWLVSSSCLPTATCQELAPSRGAKRPVPDNCDYSRELVDGPLGYYLPAVHRSSRYS